MMSFAERLRLLMERTNMTQADLSRKCGLSRATLSRYLHGQFEAKQESISKIAKATNVSEAWLMGLDATNEPTSQKVEASVLLKEPNGEQTDNLHTVPTCELVEELRHRDGVIKIVANPGQDINVNVNGPAIVLVVID